MSAGRLRQHEDGGRPRGRKAVLDLRKEVRKEGRKEGREKLKGGRRKVGRCLTKKEGREKGRREEERKDEG